MGDVSKDLFKDVNNNLNLYNNNSSNNILKSKERESQSREVIFSKKVSTKAEKESKERERDISP
jgi:hypothetical protein